MTVLAFEISAATQAGSASAGGHVAFAGTRFRFNAERSSQSQGVVAATSPVPHTCHQERAFSALTAADCVVTGFIGR
jgi:hypothetical protein